MLGRVTTIHEYVPMGTAAHTMPVTHSGIRLKMLVGAIILPLVA